MATLIIFGYCSVVFYIAYMAWVILYDLYIDSEKFLSIVIFEVRILTPTSRCENWNSYRESMCFLLHFYVIILFPGMQWAEQHGIHRIDDIQCIRRNRRSRKLSFHSLVHLDAKFIWCSTKWHRGSLTAMGCCITTQCGWGVGCLFLCDLVCF